MLDSIIDVRTPRILLIIRNAFGGAYAAFNPYSTGATWCCLADHARGRDGTGGQGVRVQERAAQGTRRSQGQGQGGSEKEAAEWLKAEEASSTSATSAS